MSNKLLLIGIDKYEKKPLNSCVKDVKDFKKILLEKYDFTESDVWELYDEKATRKNIYEALTGYVKTLKETDNLIIYFSGHGSFEDVMEMGFWMPIDGTQGVSSYFSNSTLTTLIDKVKAKHVFLISDCCFSASLLTTVPTKNFDDYSNKNSRWALVSSFGEARDGARDENSLFAETIIEFLSTKSTDFRIGELIEYVKDKFTTHITQKPQGYPIHIPSHKGGEFVFKIKSEIEVDNRNLKGYNDFLNILQIYKRTSKFVEEDKVEDRTNKIGYQLMKEHDTVQIKSMYYLYLYEGVILVQTEKAFKEKHKIDKEKLIIFLPKEKEQINFEKRKQNVRIKFNPLNVFYVDEFIRNQCTPKFPEKEESNYLNIRNFVLPSYASEVGNENLDLYIKNWYLEEGNPILVVKGAGGIGKTTFAQYIADKLSSENISMTTLFIDSAQIKDSLLRNMRNSENINIYDFYAALCDFNSEEKLSKELFRINIDAGNILLVIDGLDEVISKIPGFNTTTFLNSIYEISKNIGEGKVIITCRTHFWELSDLPKKKFNVIELLPFNEEQTSLFFQRSFSEEKKQLKALKIAKEFNFAGSINNTFHPYVLDIIRSIINDKESIEIDLSEMSSKFLKSKIKNDYIIYRICDRERKRIGQISVDEQIIFFTYMATHRNGSINKENFNEEIKNALKKHIESTNIEAFKSHPFLYERERTITFRYDFFIDYFRSIFLSKFFKYTTDVESVESNTIFLNLIKDYCWHGSTMISDIVSRIDSWDEDDELYASDLIDRISKIESIELQDKRKIISNYFIVCLEINFVTKSNNSLENTKLLNILFGSKKNINNMSIINLNSNVKFDFSGLYFNECYFDNYTSFSECRFDKDTIFHKCYLLNIKFNKVKNVIPADRFQDCIKDKNLEDAFKMNAELGISKTEQAKNFLDSYFHLFYSNGMLGRQWEDNVILPRFSGIDKYGYSYKTTSRILKKYNVVLIHKELNRNKLEINPEFKENISRYVKDGTVSDIISKLIIDFSQL